MVRMYQQFRLVVPVYVGVAYSFGAWLSLNSSRQCVSFRPLQEQIPFGEESTIRVGA
jgi:hypothetical protein